MGGGLLQLVSYGKQSEFLIKNPTISFFKYVHKKYTNFAIESIPNNFNEQIDFGRKTTCKIGKFGDLLNKMILMVELPKLETPGLSWTNGLGHSIIESIELEIGGTLIDRLTGDMLTIYMEYYLEEAKREGYYEMVKYTSDMYFHEYVYTDSMKLFIPLKFWFCRNLGSSLPLIALQYHDVSLTVEFKKFEECIYNPSNLSQERLSIKNALLYCDYIYLDSKERKIFAQKPHEFLIDQHQINTNNSIKYVHESINIPLEFNHPTKVLYWTIQNKEAQKLNLWSNFELNPRLTKNNIIPNIPLSTAVLQINGQPRFSEREEEFFRLIEPYNNGVVIPKKNIYSYNFGFNYSRFQPCGTLNFSRIDNSNLILKFNKDYEDRSVLLNDDLDIKIYAINYNILRIINGMGGVVYND